MNTVFDILSIALLTAAVGLFVMRARHESPPLQPYLVVALVAAIGNWLGNNGGGLAAVALLIAGSFLMLHLASEPFRDDAEEGEK